MGYNFSIMALHTHAIFVVFLSIANKGKTCRHILTCSGRLVKTAKSYLAFWLLLIYWQKPFLKWTGNV
ncbi:hypothetical protein Scep_020659 [Stephania cephalantha]|uniref:Uncharacterized protein n=1 Tax=Stephania cephalantha TaxID=152367 RepID=A0AAP0NPJ2_9MAGN